MKTVINNQPSSPKYPYLGIRKDQNLIVLFSAEYKGTVVNKGASPHDVGDHVISWVMSCFDPFEGSVTLSNS